MERPCPGYHHLSALVRAYPFVNLPWRESTTAVQLSAPPECCLSALLKFAMLYPVIEREKRDLPWSTLAWYGCPTRSDRMLAFLPPLGNYVTALVSHSYPVARGYLLASRWCGFLRRSSLPISSALISAILSHRGKQRLPTAQQHPSTLW